jgi:hypothetical protein
VDTHNGNCAGILTVTGNTEATLTGSVQMLQQSTQFLRAGGLIV